MRHHLQGEKKNVFQSKRDQQAPMYQCIEGYGSQLPLDSIASDHILSLWVAKFIQHMYDI
jgi:hypothetical protein